MWTFQYKHGDRPLDGYTIQRAAGRGGFGEVYYALSDSGREVALKAVQGYEQIELRGISQCMNLKSPHLVSIFDVRHNDQGRPFVIMEFVNGPSLRQLLDEAPSGLGEQKSAFFLREISKGLTFLHNCGIVHRDLKPGNVFYEDGYVKIGDYGLSKAMSVGQTSQQTVTVGTVHYMAPEIGGGNYDRSIDIYALGACLYEMLTGTVPFIGASPSEILMKHLSAEPDCSGLNEPFCSVIKKAMHKDPTRRYQSVQEMVEAVFGAEHVRNSMSMFSPDELSVVAGKVAARVGAKAPPAIPSSSVVGAGRPVATGNAWTRLNERVELSPGEPIADPMPKRDRIILAIITSAVIAIAVATLAHSRVRTGPEYGIAAFLAAWGGTVGLLIASRWSRGWGSTQHSHKFFLGGLALAGALFFSAGLAPAELNSPIQTWIAIGVPLIFLNPAKWITGHRDDRVAIKAGIGAGFCAWVCSMIFGGSPLLSVGVVSGIAMMSQILSPWQPGVRRRESLESDAQPTTANAAAAPPPFVVPPPIANPAAPSPPFNNAAYAAAPTAPLTSAFSASRVPTRDVPAAFRVAMLLVSAAALIGGLFSLIAVGTDAVQFNDKAPFSALGTCLLVLCAGAFERSRRRRMTSWWSLILRPTLLLLCVQSVIASSVAMGNTPYLSPDERMMGVFFIIFPSVMFLALLIIPTQFGNRDNVTPPPGVDVSGDVSPFKRLWALLLACVGFIGFGGIHRIYVGKIGTGILYLLTGGLFYIGTIVDVIVIACGGFKDAAGRKLLQWEDEPVDGANAPIAAAAAAAAAAPGPAPAAAMQARAWFDDIRAQVKTAGASISIESAKFQSAQQRRAMRKAVRAAKFKAMAAANRPPRDFRVVTGGALSVLATILLLASFIIAAALTLDVAGFFAAGLPNESISKHLETEVFGYAEWPELARKLGALAVGVMTLLGVAVMMFARRRGGFTHMARGAIGVTALLFALLPISRNVRTDAMWQRAAVNFQPSPGEKRQQIGKGIDGVLSELKRDGAPYVAGAMFLFSMILLSWPERRQAVTPAPNVRSFSSNAGSLARGGANAAAAPVAVATASSDSSASSKGS